MSAILEKFKKDMEGRELTKQEGNFSLLMYGSVLPCCFPPYVSKYYDFHFRSFIFVIEGKRGTIFFDLENYRRITTATYQHFLKAGDRENLPEYQDFITGWEEAAEFYDKTRSDLLAKLSDDDLHVMAGDSIKLMSCLAPTLFSESLDESLVRTYYDELGGFPEKFAAFFANGCKLTFESFAARMDKALLDFEARHDSADIQWVLADYYSSPFLENTALAAQGLLESKGGVEKVREELDKLNAELKKIQTELVDFRATLSQSEQKLLDFMQLCMYVRDIRKEPMQEILTLIANITREIYKRVGLPEEDIAYGCVLDFANRLYLRDGYKEDIKRRKKEGFVGYFNKDGYELEYGDVAKVREELYELMDGGEKKGEEIKGNVGCKGYAKAQVCIVHDETEFAKFKAGNVLVTSMTRPEFVPLMKLASAIITDEGGITCHAAIVSRELKIPCIIGTKNATRTLKDGDLVEVDVERGVVTIIERGNNSAVEETDKPAIGSEYVEGRDNGVVRILDK